MDLTHCDVLINGQELLSRVPIYLTEGEGHWRGCLHLRRGDCDALECAEYLIRLSDGRGAVIRIRKTVSTNDSRYVEVLFDMLEPSAADRQQLAQLV